LGIEGGGLGYAASANAEVAPIVMIETKQGLENVEAIVKTPGLGAIYIGPADLAGGNFSFALLVFPSRQLSL
jgi:2-keto-3-deoxy-L-rhamnonate aldolase RhmA